MRAALLGIPERLAARFDVKRFANAQAQAVWLHGIKLDVLEGDDGEPLFIASLHALTKSFRSVADIESWLHAIDQEEAPRGEVARFAAELAP